MGRSPPITRHLSAEESRLLQEINLGLPECDLASIPRTPPEARGRDANGVGTCRVDRHLGSDRRIGRSPGGAVGGTGPSSQDVVGRPHGATGDQGSTLCLKAASARNTSGLWRSARADAVNTAARRRGFPPIRSRSSTSRRESAAGTPIQPTWLCRAKGAITANSLPPRRLTHPPASWCRSTIRVSTAGASILPGMKTLRYWSA